MKRFETRQVREALAYAEAGGQALHCWVPTAAWKRRAPVIFRGCDLWAHLIDHDLERLIATVRRFGVNKVAVGREGGRGQHVDLCGGPLRAALAESNMEETRG